MKIDQSLKKDAGLPVVGAQTRNGKAVEKAAADKSTETGDSVTISAGAQAMAAQSDKEAFDVKRVDEIKAAIANGTFQIDANRIADGLIDTVKDLISSRKG